MKFIVLCTDLTDIDSILTPDAYRFSDLKSARSFIEHCEAMNFVFDIDMKFEIAKIVDLEV